MSRATLCCFLYFACLNLPVHHHTGLIFTWNSAFIYCNRNTILTWNLMCLTSCLRLVAATWWTWLRQSMKVLAVVALMHHCRICHRTCFCYPKVCNTCTVTIHMVGQHVRRAELSLNGYFVKTEGRASWRAIAANFPRRVGIWWWWWILVHFVTSFTEGFMQKSFT